MELLPNELRDILPALYATEETPSREKTAVCKFFTPDAGWTWYALEFDPVEGLFFGIVDGLEAEWGYFSLEELESIRGPLRLPVERDLYFKPTPVAELGLYGLFL
jgi:hypothetical protein